VVVRRVREKYAVALLLYAVAACDQQPAPPQSQDDGGTHHSSSRGHDGGMPKGSKPSDAGSPTMMRMDAMVPLLPSSSGPICSLQVGAECDGTEDCPKGEVCCGKLADLVPWYETISCQKSCPLPQSYEICHAGTKCRDGSQCRRSVIIPHEFIGICSIAGRDEKPTGDALKGEVACGPTTCQVGTQKCCLNAKVTFSSPPMAEPAYCAPLSAGCLCDEMPPLQSDAGDETDGG
jgi:hypothetical protein